MINKFQPPTTDNADKIALSYPEYVYDDPVAFLQDHFYIPETNAPITLTDHQKRVIYALTATDENGDFLYSTWLYSSMKKSAKTAIAAGLGLWHSWRYPFGKVYIVGNDQKQADSRAAEAVRNCIALHPEWRDLIKVIKYHIELPNNTTIEALPVDPRGESGMNPSAVIWTEAWAVKYASGEDMWTETTLSPTRAGKSFRLVESYAGFSGESPLLERLYNSAVVQGKRIDPDIELYVNETAGMIAYWNTTYHLSWQTPAYYAQQAAILKPEEYSRIHENKWVTSTSKFIPDEWWASAKCELPPMDMYLEVVIALDAAVSDDCFAIVMLSRVEDKLQLRFAQKWQPEKGEKLDYRAEGGPRDVLIGLIDKYNPLVVAYDEYQLHEFCTTLADETDTNFQVFSQGADRAIADKQLYDLLKARRIQHNGAFPDVAEHLSNSDAKLSGQPAQVGGDEKPDSKLRIVKRKQELKIDLTVALSMCAAKALELLSE